MHLCGLIGFHPVDIRRQDHSRAAPIGSRYLLAKTARRKTAGAGIQLRVDQRQGRDAVGEDRLVFPHHRVDTVIARRRCTCGGQRILIEHCDSRLRVRRRELLLQQVVKSGLLHIRNDRES